MGIFQTDEHRSFGGQVFQLFSRMTWEAPQTIAGNLYSHARNIQGAIHNVDYYGGATLVNRNNPDVIGWGLTLGSYINGTNLEADPYIDETFRHEYGHTLQSRLVGPLYLTSVAVQSGIGQLLADFGVNTHNREWYETQANRMALRYFSKFEPDALVPNPATGRGIMWDFNENPTKYNPNWYWLAAHPPLGFEWWLFF